MDKIRVVKILNVSSYRGTYLQEEEQVQHNCHVIEQIG